MNNGPNPKSYIIQFILNVLFGPLGLFYSSKLYGIIFSITILPTIMVFGFGLFIGWPISIIVGLAAVSDYNRKRNLDKSSQKRLRTGLGASTKTKKEQDFGDL